MNAKFLKAILWIVSIVSLVPVMVISIYSRPCVDDFGYSLRTYNVVKNNPWDICGLIQAALETNSVFYNSWQGLYSSTLLMSLQPGIWGPNAYMLSVFIIVCVLYIALCFFILTFRHFTEMRKSSCYLVAFVFTCFVLQYIPSPVEGLYWFNGACNYMLFLSFTIINVAFIYKAFRYDGKIKYIVYASLLSFWMSGGNHVTSFLNILIILFGFLLWGCNTKAKVFLCPLTTALLGFYIMYTAPGTAIRQNAIGENASIISTMWESIRYSISLFGKWATLRWGLMLLTTASFSWLYLKKHPDKLLHPILVGGSMFIAFWGILCVPYYPMCCFGAGRVHNIFFITFNVFTLVFTIYTVLYIKHLYFKHIKQKKYIVKYNFAKYCYLLSVILILSFLLSKETTAYKAVNEMNDGIAQSFSREFDKRLYIMSSSTKNRNAGIIKFTPLPQSELLKFDDITANKDDWRNRQWAEYFGVYAIVP